MLTEIKTYNEHYFRDEQGRRQGEYKSWYWSGLPRVHSGYVDDELHGEFKQWDKDGHLEYHCFYVNGRFHGEFKIYSSRGKLIKHCFYVKNKEVSFKEIPYPVTPEDHMYFKLKYDLQLLPVEATC